MSDEIEEVLKESGLPVKPGFGYILSRRLCIMQTSDGWWLMAYAEECPSEVKRVDDMIEWIPPFFLVKLKNVDGTRTLIQLLRKETNV